MSLQISNHEESCMPFCFERMQKCQSLCKVNVPSEYSSKEFDLICSSKCHEEFKKCLTACG